MTETFLGRRLIVTTLKRVPPRLRCNAAAVAVTELEAERLKANDEATFKQIAGELYRGDLRDVENVEGET